jgi:AbrB family looped-hinge helix DNA binding protein
MKIEGIQARINENGRIVVPAVIRKGMGLKLGDSVVLSLEDGVLRMEPHRVKVGKTRNEIKRIAKPEVPPSSDIAQERRGQPQTETDEWLG